MVELKVPVVFFVFNRIETTKRVFDAIRRVKPKKLYLVSDAARNAVKGEKEVVDAVRNYIENNIDWECKIFKNYAKENMGCGKRISSGIDWVFSQEEEAIFLEDDCLPDDTFFRYCQDMLEHYRYDDRIFIVSGNNPLVNYEASKEYLFTKIPVIWGWASWRRSWKFYDYDLKTWPVERKNPVFKKIFPLKAYWIYMSEFDVLYHHKFDTWDYQLLYATVLNHKLNIVPRKSYTQNIGFQEGATHISEAPEWISQEMNSCVFPIAYLEEIEWDEEFDKCYFKQSSKYGMTVKIKSLLGMDINKSIWGMH